ncbi:MAG: alpha/beta fold hydrolase, partial [Chitinophagaceae bacterium]
MKKILLTTLKWLIAMYIIICVVLYFFQEKLIFFPQKLTKGFKFSFDTPFEEVSFKMKDDVLLNGILFKARNSKGLIFYLHGNAGSIDSWGDVAKTYTDLNYDVLIIDYRGYGKSEGKISSEKQVFDDLQIVYDNMKGKYEENKIIILGYSIGSGPAARIASVNNPRMLILQAPYYSLTDMMRHSYPIIPVFLLKYKFQTNRI